MLNWWKKLFEVRQDEPEIHSEPISQQAPDSEGTAWYDQPGMGWYKQHMRKNDPFWVDHPIPIPQRKEFLLGEFNKAIAADDQRLAYSFIDVVLHSDDQNTVPLLHEMLLVRGHRHHQEIVRMIQLIGDPASVPYLRKAFDESVEHMIEYNGSGSGVVAKWFSHAFRNIGTPEAIAAIQEYAQHPDPEIRDEMLYRLARIAEYSKQ